MVTYRFKTTRSNGVQTIVLVMADNAADAWASVVQHPDIAELEVSQMTGLQIVVINIEMLPN